MMKQKNIEDFLNQSLRFAESIEEKQNELITLLTEYETYETAVDEINRSVTTLRGFEEEFANIKVKEHLSELNISTFFPLNLPLYSLVIFGIAPGAFAKNVFIRPPIVMHKTLNDLWRLMNVDSFYPNLTLKPTPRQIFMDLYAKDSDVILFTGKYENALDISAKCPDALLIYNGSGVNPFLLFSDADVDLAAEKAVEMRCFNSGQDCAGPDAFFVPSNLIDSFIEKVAKRLDRLEVGNSKNSQVKVSATQKISYIDELEEWLKDRRETLVYGGKIDRDKNLVFPSIVRDKLRKNEEFHEFFAPYFYVLEYTDDESLLSTLLNQHFMDRGMYISVFGNNEYVESKLKFVKLLKNKIINDVEIGNEEYGGFGAHANFLLYKGQKIDKPILISRDLHDTLALSSQT